MSMDRFPAHYEPIRELSEGGFGVIWEAREPGGETVVIKMPKATTGTDEIARFRREIQLQSQLDHANILPILDYDVDCDLPWYAAPLADGNLAEKLPELSPEVALALFSDIVAGMSHAHRNRVLHRDIKPANVLVFGDGAGRPVAKVSDFGLGRNYTRDASFQTRTGMMAGTPWYAAPEQFMDLRRVDHRADIFGLGRLLEYLLGTAVPAGSALRRRLEYCVRTSTAQRPDDRYQSIEDLAADLRLVLEQPRAVQRPVDAALGMVQELLAQGMFDAAATRPLAQVLCEYRHDARLMLGMLPRIPAVVWTSLLDHHIAATREVLRGYLTVLEEPLAVDSVTAAMRLLDDVFDMSRDDEVHETCLLALLRLAVRYDIAELAAITARCVAEEDSSTVLQALARHLRDDPLLAVWCAEHLGAGGLAPILRDAIRV